MTSKEYYKQTSEMSYPIRDWHYDNGNNSITAIVPLKEGETAEDILKANDFYAICGYTDKMKNVSYDINDTRFFIIFQNSPKKYRVYELGVCSRIECGTGGGEMVFSCEGYDLKEDYDEEWEKSIKEANEKKRIRHWFDYDNFPSFDDFFKEFSDLVGNQGKFCEVSYQYDSDGNGYYRKVDNNGVVEKRFRCDGNEIKEIKEVKEVPIQDDNPTETKITELKDLIK